MFDIFTPYKEWVKSGNTWILEERYNDYRVLKYDDIYFKNNLCTSGVVYTYINDINNVYKTDLETGDGYSLNCYYSEYDVIDEYKKNFTLVDVCVDYNVDLTLNYYELDNIVLIPGHLIILINQNDSKENDIYFVNENYFLQLTDILNTREKSDKFSCVVKLGTYFDRQMFLRSVLNDFPISGESKEFFEARGYILKHNIDYDINYNEPKCIEPIEYKINYGYLYNWYAVNTGKLVPVGYRVPNDDDFNILSTYLGGDSVAGGKLKSVRVEPVDSHPRWNTPNTDALDDYNFLGFGGGARTYTGVFIFLGDRGYMWTTDEYDISSAKSRYLYYSTGQLFSSFSEYTFYKKNTGQSIRFLRDATPEEILLNDGYYLENVFDFDNNLYRMVKIGTQVWSQQNLKTTNYNDGTPIQNLTGNTEWNTDTIGAYCSWNNEPLSNYEYVEMYDSNPNCVYSPPKIVLSDYTIARHLPSINKDFYTGFSIPINIGDNETLTINYNNETYNISYTTDMVIENISYGSGITNVSGYTSYFSPNIIKNVGDFLEININSGISNILNYKTFIKYIDGDNILVNDNIPDNLINDLNLNPLYYNYEINNLNYFSTTPIIYNQLAKCPLNLMFFGFDITTEVNFTPMIHKYDVIFDYDGLEFVYSGVSYKFNTNNYYINYKLYDFLNNINSVFNSGYTIYNSGYTTTTTDIPNEYDLNLYHVYQNDTGVTFKPYSYVYVSGSTNSGKTLIVGKTNNHLIVERPTNFNIDEPILQIQNINNLKEISDILYDVYKNVEYSYFRKQNYNTIHEIFKTYGIILDESIKNDNVLQSNLTGLIFQTNENRFKLKIFNVY